MPYQPAQSRWWHEPYGDLPDALRHIAEDHRTYHEDQIKVLLTDAADSIDTLVRELTIAVRDLDELRAKADIIEAHGVEVGVYPPDETDHPDSIEVVVDYHNLTLPVRIYVNSIEVDG